MVKPKSVVENLKNATSPPEIISEPPLKWVVDSHQSILGQDPPDRGSFRQG
jgi:hypothetical protein